jgi:hypothetical protein
MTSPVLTVTKGLREGETFPITKGGIRIGRESSNELWLDDGEVSRQHARVIMHNGAVWVQDAGSRNGVFVNGNRVPGSVQVSVGAVITIGTHSFEVRQPELDAESSIIDFGGIVDSAPVGKSWKVWPFVLAVVLSVVIVFAMVIARNGNIQEAQERAELEAVANQEEVQERSSATDALRMAMTENDEVTNSVPAPPEGTTARELADAGIDRQQSGYLQDALVAFQQCLMIDPGFSVCRSRVETVADQILQTVERESIDCDRYLDAQQYREAISSCRLVMELSPDPASELHINAKRAYDEAERMSDHRY